MENRNIALSDLQKAYRKWLEREALSLDQEKSLLLINPFSGEPLSSLKTQNVVFKVEIKPPLVKEKQEVSVSHRKGEKQTHLARGLTRRFILFFCVFVRDCAAYIKS